jgi:hypothetical protein
LYRTTTATWLVANRNPTTAAVRLQLLNQLVNAEALQSQTTTSIL